MESVTEDSEESKQENGDETSNEEMTPIDPSLALGPEYGCNWIDITSEFFEATKELDLGELLHDRMFGLFDAMSAIEMMDPKMDAGMMCNRGNRVLTFDKAVKSGVLKLNNFSMEELVGIMDCIFGCLVTWLEGHSAAQTVLTCLYLHKPLTIEDRALRSFCVLTLKLVALINNIVNIASVYEEEDFQPSLYGYGECAEVPEPRAAGAVREVEEELQRVVKSSRNKQGEPWEPLMQKQHEDAVALFSRVRFLRLLYAALAAYMRRDLVSMQEAERCLASCTELVCIMQNTVGRGLRPKASKETKEDDLNRGDYGHMMGFEPLVNQRLLPPTFPRYTRLRTRREALQYLESMVTRIRQCGKITHTHTFQQAMEFLEKFSEFEPCVLSRSIAQVLYLGTGPNSPSANGAEDNKLWGGQNMADTLRGAAKQFICPPALITKAPVLQNPQAKAYIDNFFLQCVRPFEQLLQMNGHNRARQRDKVTELLKEFASLQDEADDVDEYLHNCLLKSENPRPHLSYLGTWILHHTLRLMLHYLLTGFSLQLYAHHEYHYIYWYLYEFVYVWLVSGLTRADELLPDHDAEQQPPVSRSRGSRSAHKKARKPKKVHRPYGREITFYQAQQHLCGGYYKAMLGLREHGKVTLPQQEFDDEKVRFQHRFSPFDVVVTPPPVSYQTFTTMTDLSNFPQPVTPSSLYHDARNHFFKAKTLLESIHYPTAEMMAMLKIVKTNFVVMKLLEGGHKQEDKSPPKFDYTYHSCFPIIRV